MQLLAAIMLSLITLCALAQEPGKTASGPLAEFNMAIATVMKTPVALNSKGKKNDGFCKRPDVLNGAEIKKLQISCEKIFSDTTVPEIQRTAAKYILGKTKAQYMSSALARRYCDEASILLESVADFYEEKNISGNGPHEAMAHCLIFSERYYSALAWTERGIKRKETSQMQYLEGYIWQKLQELKLAQNAFKRSIALDENNEAAKKSLAEINEILAQSRQATTPKPDPITTTDHQECEEWKEAIRTSRQICDHLLSHSYEEFISCLEEGMNDRGYRLYSDEQTQTLFQDCGAGSWTDESLKP